MNTLPSGSLNQRRDDTVSFYAIVRPRPEADFSEDHHVPERLLSVIIRRRDVGNA